MPHREVHHCQTLLGSKRRLHGAAEELGYGNCPLSRRGARDDCTAKRRSGETNLCRRIGIGEAAADGAAIPGLNMTDEA